MPEKHPLLTATKDAPYGVAVSWNKEYTMFECLKKGEWGMGNFPGRESD